MSYNLFLDDERMPPNDGKVWVIARSSKEAEAIVVAKGAPSYVSFDHDLGDADTAMEFVWFLIDSYTAGFIKSFPTKYYVHSQNPVGAANICGLMYAFIKYEVK